MLRFVVILFGIIIVVPLIRSIIGIIMRGFADLLKTETSASSPEGPRKAEVPEGGELKKDPVCGTYVSTATAIKKGLGADTVYFCSQACKDRFRG